MDREHTAEEGKTMWGMIDRPAQLHDGIEPHETAAVEVPPRGFAALHRDVWRAAGKAPVVMLLVPVTVWLAMACLPEPLQRLAGWPLGTLVAGVQLAALRRMAGGEPVRLLDALRGGLRMWGRLLYVSVLGSTLTLLGTLLFIVPGLYLYVRFSLAMPVAAFEGKSGLEALQASGRHVKGSGWTILFQALGSVLLYGPAMVAAAALLSPDSGLGLARFVEVPVQVLASLATIGLALIYLDRAPGVPAAEPVGRASGAGTSPAPSGARGVLVAGTLSYGSVAAALLAVVVAGSWMISSADKAFEAGDYETARERYERAARWSPDDPYIEYSLAWAHLMAERPRRALEHMARANELDAQNPYYALDHALVLVALQRTDEARLELERAMALGHPEPQRVEEVLLQIATADEAARQAALESAV